jgi:hypothetical protein
MLPAAVTEPSTAAAATALSDHIVSLGDPI